MTAARGDREFDVVVFGATGFTGLRTARRLAAVAPSDLRWAVAGRREPAVREIADELGAGALFVDVGDGDGVGDMARRTRVVLSTAGPFAKFGDPVVDACVAAGTDYADLTGEVHWMRSLVLRLHDAARERGVRLIPASGFDSVPADLAVHVALREAAHRGGRLASARTVYRLRGGLNGGTLASALGIFEEADPRMLADPFALVPGHQSTRDERERLADPRRPEFDGTGGRWVAPFFMGPINRRVVRRSIALRAGTPLGGATADTFRYDEFQSVSKGSGKTAAWTTTLMLGLGEAAMRTRAGRSLIRRIGPSPGEGPSERTLANGLSRATTTCGLEGGDAFTVEQDMAGDPGNAATVRALVETGLALLESDGEGGVLTPSTALGDRLVERLERTGEHSLRVTTV